ncbi:MAG: hypothetical protein O7D98_03960 [Candidatus Dadabacteria bacterium]|nr:hypothetical protein [Candidatus Dadabacteria bacterium]
MELGTKLPSFQDLLYRVPHQKSNLTSGPIIGGQVNPDLDIAAERLGISEAELRRALGPPPPNLSEAARKLGISESKLRRALHNQ